MKPLTEFKYLLIAAALPAFGLFSCGEDDSSDDSLLMLPFVIETTSEPVTTVSVTGPENEDDAEEGVAPYFRDFSLTLNLIQDDSLFPDKVDLSDVSITDTDENISETSSYRGVLLRDILMDTDGAAFRPMDKGKDGRATAVIARSNDGKVAVFSFWELIKTDVGNNVVLAYEKNGATISSGEGDFILVSANDTPSKKRYITQLSSIEVINEWVEQIDGDTTESFAISGDVDVPVEINIDSALELEQITFSGVGPSFQKTYRRGTGTPLLGVIETAGFRYPDELNRCYILLEAADKYRNVFSCGELAYTTNGSGAGTEKHPGTLLVTSDFQSAVGTFSFDCTVDVDQCTVDDGATWEDESGDFMTVVSSEDSEPFGWPEDDARINLGGRHTSWITSLRVIYVE